MRAVGLDFEMTKWLEKEHKNIQIANYVKESRNDGDVVTKEQIEIAMKFIEEFKQKLIESKTRLKLIRLIEEKMVCFGPKKKGPNILINKYIDKSESFF